MGHRIDGKTIRGARCREQAAPQLVAAFDHASGTVLGQAAVAAKSNEIPAVRDLRNVLDVDGSVVTPGVMHTQTDTAAAIIIAGPDYTLCVKNNQNLSTRPSKSPRCQPGSPSRAQPRSPRSDEQSPIGEGRPSRSST